MAPFFFCFGGDSTENPIICYISLAKEVKNSISVNSPTGTIKSLGWDNWSSGKRVNKCSDCHVKYCGMLPINATNLTNPVHGKLLLRSIGSITVISYLPAFLFCCRTDMFQVYSLQTQVFKCQHQYSIDPAGFIFIVLEAIASTSFGTENSVDIPFKDLNIPANIDSVWSLGSN